MVDLTYTVYVGGEKTMKEIAGRGFINVLNRKTMRYQKFGKDAKYVAIKDPDTETGWMVLSDRNVREEAKQQGFII